MKPISIERGLRALLLFSSASMIIYWFLWCIFSPVTNGDSRTYNLARLWFLERGGLFGNPYCIWSWHLILPWTFDAAHYPFLYLQYGYELPSFLCFIGILAAAYRMISGRFGRDSGLVAIAGLLGLPMLVYQAVNTKNDLVLAFGLIVWFYALDRYVRQPHRLHLSMAAVALAIVLGSKTTGLFFGALAVAITPPSVSRAIWNRRDLIWFTAVIVISFFLWSSWEIYLNNKLQFGYWLGNPSDYRGFLNHDGWRGISANFVRDVLSFCDPFIVPESARLAFGHWKATLCERVLAHFGAINAGMMKSDWRQFSEVDFARICPGVYTENSSTFGLLGTLGMFAAPLILVARRRWDLASQFAAFSVAAFIAAVCLVGWHPGNSRFFVAPFAFAFCGMVAWAYGSSRLWPVWVLRMLALASLWWVPAVAVSKPLHRLPTAIARPLDLLPQSETLLRHRLDKLVADGQVPLLLYCERRGKIFYVFDRLRENVVPVTHLDQATFDRIKSRYGKESYLVLVMNSEIPNVSGLEQFEHIMSQNEERKKWPDTLLVWIGSR
jgi:hypothetical protein